MMKYAHSWNEQYIKRFGYEVQYEDKTFFVANMGCANSKVFGDKMYMITLNATPLITLGGQRLTLSVHPLAHKHAREYLVPSCAPSQFPFARD